MTETDDEPTPDAEPTAPPKRELFFARLAVAVRRQDWFVVALEVAIVVLGVIIGFQVTSWGQARSDRAKEQVYLRQLAADLRQTERRIFEADSLSRPVLWAGGQAVRAYRMAERPPRDSLVAWIYGGFNYHSAAPVLGTAEALIATGDLSLVRDDSLRSAIPAYLEQMGTYAESYRVAVDGVLDAFVSMARRVDFWDAYESIPQVMIDSLSRSNHDFGFPVGPRRRPFPVDPYDLLEDQDVYSTLYLARTLQMNLTQARAGMLHEARTLRDLVEPMVDP